MDITTSKSCKTISTQIHAQLNCRANRKLICLSARGPRDLGQSALRLGFHQPIRARYSHWHTQDCIHAFHIFLDHPVVCVPVALYILASIRFTATDRKSTLSFV